jgi:hypothetical protein
MGRSMYVPFPSTKPASYFPATLVLCFPTAPPPLPFLPPFPCRALGPPPSSPTFATPTSCRRAAHAVRLSLDLSNSRVGVISRSSMHLVAYVLPQFELGSKPARVRPHAMLVHLCSAPQRASRKASARPPSARRPVLANKLRARAPLLPERARRPRQRASRHARPRPGVDSFAKLRRLLT